MPTSETSRIGNGLVSSAAEIRRRAAACDEMSGESVVTSEQVSDSKSDTGVGAITDA